VSLPQEVQKYGDSWHSASTLSGNSGSPVVALVNGGNRVLGIHVGGEAFVGNRFWSGERLINGFGELLGSPPTSKRMEECFSRATNAAAAGSVTGL